MIASRPCRNNDHYACAVRDTCGCDCHRNACNDRPVIEGAIYEKLDELFIVEKVYETKKPDAKGGFISTTHVKVRCIEPTPIHLSLTRFEADYEPYDPREEE